MKIRDTFEDIKNTLKMEIGKISVKNIDMPDFKTETKNMKFESEASIRKLTSKIIPKIVNFNSKEPKINDLEMPEEYFKLNAIAMEKSDLRIEQVKLPENKIDLNVVDVIKTCKDFSFVEFVFPNSVKKCDTELKCVFDDKHPDQLKTKVSKVSKVPKSIKIHRLKTPRSLPIMKKPVKKSSVNFIYVFKGKEYLERLGHPYSDLIFLNYFDNLPMDLAVKIIVEENEIKLFYKRGIPHNIVDIALFKSKKTGKLLIAPVKRHSK